VCDRSRERVGERENIAITESVWQEESPKERLCLCDRERERGREREDIAITECVWEEESK